MKLRYAMGLLVVCFALSACSEKEEAKPEVSSKQTEQAEVAKAQPEDTTKVTELAQHAGKKIHDANCISCHDSSVYTREERRVQDFPKLLAQVRLCDANLGTSLFDEDIEQVADYLNQAYYQFKK